MAPPAIQELRSADLAWISDFVMEQCVLAFRPVVEQLQDFDDRCTSAESEVRELSSSVMQEMKRISCKLDSCTELSKPQGIAGGSGLRDIEQPARLQQQMDGLCEGLTAIENSMRSFRTDVVRTISGVQSLEQQIAERSQAMVDVERTVKQLTSEVASAVRGVLHCESRLAACELQIVSRPACDANLPKLDAGLAPAPFSRLPTPSRSIAHSTLELHTNMHVGRSQSQEGIARVRSATGSPSLPAIQSPRPPSRPQSSRRASDSYEPREPRQPSSARPLGTSRRQVDEGCLRA